MSKDILEKARETADTLEKERAQMEKAAAAAAVKERVRVLKTEKRRDRVAAAIAKADSRLNPVFADMARVLKNAGFKDFKYERKKYEAGEYKVTPFYKEYENGIRSDHEDTEGLRESAFGKSISYVFSAPAVGDLQISLFVGKNAKSPNEVSCGVVDYAAAKAGKWPLIKKSQRERDTRPGYGDEIDYTEEREYFFAAEVASAPLQSGTIEKALSEWFSSVAAKNEAFSGLLRKGMVSLRVDVPFPSSGRITETGNFRAGFVRKHAVPGTRRDIG